MQLSKNKKYQYLFFSILSIYIIFNGGNSNLFIQLNFVLLSLFFLYCLNDKNYNLHLKNFYINNKKSIFLYLFFLIFLIFQIIPLPENILKYFSQEKYRFIISIENISYSSISLSPVNSYFQILNFIFPLLLTSFFDSSMESVRFPFITYTFIGFFIGYQKEKL